MQRGQSAQLGAWTTINEKPPEFPQGVIACRTPCALEPDVSEANSFSQIGRRSVDSGSRAISSPRPLALRPAVAGGLPFSRVPLPLMARTVPTCNHNHNNGASYDLGKLPYCFLH